MHQFAISVEETSKHPDSQGYYGDLSEDQLADLALRVGKNLKILGGLDTSQIADLFDRLLGVRYIQSYILWRDQAPVCERWFPSPATAETVTIIVTLKESSSGLGPSNLDDESLGELAQRIGEDLEAMRSLDQLQIKDVLNRTYRMRYLRGFDLWSGQNTGGLDFDVLLADFDVAATNATSPMNLECASILQMREEGVDRITSTSARGETQHQNTSRRAETGALGKPMSISPAYDAALAADPTPLASRRNTSRSKRKRMHCNSPPGYCSRQTDRKARSNRNGPRRDRSTAPAIRSNPTIESLLKGCRFNNGKVLLDNKKVREVLQADARLLSPDPSLRLGLLVDQWDANVSQSRHALGLPKEWNGLNAAVDYMQLLDSGTGLDPIAARIAYVLLYLNYKNLCRHPEKFCPRPRARSEKNESLILNCMLDLYRDDPKLCWENQNRRNRITGGLLRKAAWWWSLAATLGLGLLLTAGDELIKEIYNDTFSSAQIDALATYVSYTRPETVRLFHSLEPIVKSLMLGELPDAVRALCGAGLSHQLSTASAADERAFAAQSIRSLWTPIDTKQRALNKIDSFF